MKQLDFFEKMSKWVLYRNFNGKNTLFYPFLWQKSLTSFFFGRFWPIFLFLREMCSFGLSSYESTRFFEKKSKLPSETAFWWKKYPFFSLNFQVFTQFWPQSAWPFLFRPILADFLIPPGNMFIWAVFLWMNSIFWKKMKIGFRNVFLVLKKTLFSRLFTRF